MPLEIRELHIKAVVGNERGTTAAPKADALREEDREALIAECVAQVLETLRHESER